MIWAWITILASGRVKEIFTALKKTCHKRGWVWFGRRKPHSIMTPVATIPATLRHTAQRDAGVPALRSRLDAQRGKGASDPAHGGRHPGKGGTHFEKVRAHLFNGGTHFAKLPAHHADGGAHLEKLPAHLLEVSAPFLKVGAPFLKVPAHLLKVGTHFLKGGAPIAKVGAPARGCCPMAVAGSTTLHALASAATATHAIT